MIQKAKTYVTILTLAVCSAASAQAMESSQSIGEKILAHYYKIEDARGDKSWKYDWNTAIFMYGADRFLTSAQSNSTVVSSQLKLQKIFELQAEKKLPVVTAPDLAAMSLPATSFLENNSSCPSCRQMVDNTIEYFHTEPLNSIGAFDHVGKRYRPIPWLPPAYLLLGSCIYVDSATMYILGGVRIAQLNGDSKMLEFFLNQFDIFHHYLFDEATGLYKQAYYPATGRRDPNQYFWARGDLWMVTGLIDTLEILSPTNPHYPVLVARLQRNLQALSKYVDQEKGLKTLINDPSSDNYYESSSSALMAYALLKATRLGLFKDPALQTLGQTLAKNLRRYLVNVTTDEISVTQISGATTAFNPDWYYKNIIRPGADKSHGVGAFLLMLSESK